MIGALAVLVLIYLTGKGAAVLINITLPQEMPIINITLPTQPLGPITVMNSTGQPIPYYLNDNVLLIPMAGPGNVTIKYTPHIGVLSNGTMYLSISSAYGIQLYVTNNILLTTVPSNIINFQEVSTGAVMTLAPGNYTIDFIVTGQGTTQQAVQGAVGATTTKPSHAQPYHILTPMTLELVVTVIVVVIAIVLLIRRRSKNI